MNCKILTRKLSCMSDNDDRCDIDDDNITYISQLNLYYDAKRDVYLTESGKTVTANHFNKRANDLAPIDNYVNNSGYYRRAEDKPTTQTDSIMHMKFDFPTVIKIVGATVVLVGQYYLMDSKLKELDYHIQTLQSVDSQTKDSLAELQHQLSVLTAQQNIQNDVLNTIQFKLSVDKTVRK